MLKCTNALHTCSYSLLSPPPPAPPTPAEWAQEVIRLAVKYKDEGVVGIDIAGDELLPFDPYIPYFEVGVA